MDNILVISSSNPCTSSSVFVAKLTETSKTLDYTQVEPDWTYVEQDVTFKCNEITIKSKNGADYMLTSILISPKDRLNKNGPVILLPHGGPHLVSSASFNREILFYTKFGFKVILVNYRGSAGVSEQFLNSLCGNIGTADVQDVLACLKYYQSQNEIDPKNIMLLGPSECGILVTSLITRDDFDFKFKACIAINPIIDIASSVGMSDIPDWFWVETEGFRFKYDPKLVPDKKTLEKMNVKSPIRNLDKVTTPTLFLLGSKDKRVSYFQGLQFHLGLKARKIETKCFVYKDNHSLGKPVTQIDRIINSIVWFLKFTG